MSGSRAKICGLTQESDASLAESSGADFLGVIMAGGPRNIEARQAARVLGPRRQALQRVAVFGSQTCAEIAGIAEQLDLDVIQLHGAPAVSDIEWFRARLRCAVWPVLRVDSTTISEEAVEWGQAAGSLLLDAKVVGRLGGTGVSLDWGGLAGRVAEIRQQVPGLMIIVAGGLTASNVQMARRLLMPDVVDVSSGVESALGVKDAERLKEFIAAAHAHLPATNESA